MLRSKSANRRLAGVAAFLFVANLSSLRADDAFQMPVPASGDPSVTANFPTGEVQAAPATVPSATSDRWARRSQQIRNAAVQGIPSAQPMGGYAQQPMDLSQPLAVQTTNGFQQQLPPVPAPALVAQGGQRLPFSGKFNTAPLRGDIGNLPEAETIKTPNQLPKVTQIMPFLDYEPDPKIAAEDPCQNLCPRPDGAPCKTAEGRAQECPSEIQLSTASFQPRLFPPSTYTWQASNIFYQPLYFEDPDLERYGHAWPFFIQPIVSSVRFTAQAVGIPYQMTIDPCCCRVYPLGYYRPGECAPKLIYQIPWNTEAAAVEAGTIAGIYFLFPSSAWSTSGGIISP
jgi:hypothetical protein